MMPTSQTKSSVTVTIGIFSLLAIFLGGVLYFVFFGGSEMLMQDNDSTSEGSFNLPKVNPSHTLFENPKFTELRYFSDLPIEVGTLGRENPFFPFSTTTGIIFPPVQDETEDIPTDDTNTSTNSIFPDIGKK